MPADPETIKALLTRTIEAAALDPLTCAHLSATFLAPAGSFVTVAPITGEIRVCVGRRSFTKADDVWTDWPGWRARWRSGPTDAALALMDIVLPGWDVHLYPDDRVGAPYVADMIWPEGTKLGDWLHLGIEARGTTRAVAIVNGTIFSVQALIAQQEDRTHG